MPPKGELTQMLVEQKNVTFIDREYHVIPPSVTTLPFTKNQVQTMVQIFFFFSKKNEV